MFNYRFDVILSHKKFTWTDFGRVLYPIYPRRYAIVYNYTFTISFFHFFSLLRPTYFNRFLQAVPLSMPLPYQSLRSTMTSQ